MKVTEQQKIKDGGLGRKLYSVRESYWISYNGIRTLRYMFKAKKNKEMSSKFIERLMLTVTEVNGCAICSYAHSKRALESGMNSGEIQNMLSGIMDDVPSDELAAVMFAQHYADTRGNPTHESWQRIVEIYGMNRAMGILGSIRTIMMGNTYGIPWSSFFNRLRGRADPRSSLLYEVEMMLGTILVPFSVIHALISGLFGRAIISF
ncbi:MULTISPECIES: carboxymuconolactone decarboxylase family protein [Methanobacterium]|uniref:Alkylhydroperoxidase n=1 Tax=Methanobacterium subterraneum TaxID=59277 RepID=A0A2H4V915_9EURY|nr:MULTISPECIES: carboxymuconolactone decarboxylase family protein [Methanobacterium]MBW4257117.1 carboxymuconolactone decarboxylase family protein [Methanobacterium sp. YSL]PKL73152.1 MAG: alkylhydroperoxidase [Methanobacteriales archaeon HGW-Methanobacteriales-2]AUB54578.1 alkylhydroperoxidase [Methanobacterium subterraneum]AUB58544.1 alkylhydroperoxidase [Methanobacterium sp. MZ-A1]AUB59445.1 alkylhydroperoxidase [Methanobacterium subterraneum]